MPAAAFPLLLLLTLLAACTPGLDEPPRGASEALLALHEAATTPEGQYELGMAYELDIITAHDEQRALFWLDRSAQQGYAPAQYELGGYYTLPGTKDYSQAMLWFRLAAEQGFPPALEALGLLYATGVLSGQPDLIEAYAWLQMAADQGEDVDQAIDHVVGRLTIDEFAEASRRYQELVARDR